MQNYKKFIKNITELIEKGLVSTKDIKEEVENIVKFQADNIVNKLNLVSREEFEVQKKIIQKLQEDLARIKRKGNISNRKTTKAKKS